jgi:hypothetical protein
MAEGSGRGGRSSIGPLVVAVIFLAVLGAGAGFSLGTLTRDAHVSASGGGSGSGSGTGTTTTTPPANQGQPSPVTPISTTTGGHSSTGTGGDSRCPQHTEQLAKAGQLTLLEYLHTAASEVWVCRSGDGTLFYQGHRIKASLNENLVEGDNALFLTTIQPEDNGWVATNTDPTNGNVTRYHVKPHKLIIEYVWNGKTDEQDAVS